MDSSEFVLRHDATNRIVTELLIQKYGEERIQGLLSDDFCIEPNRKKNVAKAYVRSYKAGDDIFHDGTKPDSILAALDDAREEMNYSNWAADKFDRAGEIIIRYCIEHDIPISFKEDEERANASDALEQAIKITP